ncbi:MAG: carbon-nitrogen hydrolase family protein [Deltaproteobacteria bacterium]|jgi:predicted amidohydrolase|nr:carbon-nitrogen hydrolase family protein [Deltaproteobacteria bacterium]
MNTIKVSLLHPQILHSRVRENRSLVTAMAGEAADLGARIVVAPEMCLSGYIFQDRMAMAPFVETADGPSADAFSKLAKEKSIFLVAGFAENDPETGIYYNTAFAWGPNGKVVARYRKVNAESRWACPGPPVQDNVFDTPWGKCGLLICSDTYHSLPARSLALKGARMILIPSNWPPTGSFPEDVWRFRAMENGTWLACANRTGDELDFNCQECESYFVDPQGKVVARHKSPDSLLLSYEIPLTHSGDIDAGPRREEILASRRPYLWHRLYANLAFFRDITAGFKLPAPGVTELHLVSPGKGKSPADALEEGAGKLSPGSVAVLPLQEWDDADVARLEKVAKDRGCTVLTAEPDAGYGDGEDDRTHILVNADGADRVPVPFDRTQELMHLGTLAALPVRMADLVHPETALEAAKRGADILIAVERELGPDDLFTVSMRPIDQAACCVCASDGAGLGLVPEGHSPGTGSVIRGNGWLTVQVDSAPLRVKRFQDRADFELLFQGAGNGPWE